MHAPITAIYAAVAALMVLLLMANVIRFRRRLRIGMGAGGNDAVRVAIRAHANAIETIPTALLLLLLLELNGAPAPLLHALGLLLLASRAFHAQGLLVHGGGDSNGRFYGTLGTWIVLAASIVALPVLVLA